MTNMGRLQTLMALPKARLHLSGLAGEIKGASTEVLALASGLVVMGDGMYINVRLRPNGHEQKHEQMFLFPHSTQSTRPSGLFTTCPRLLRTKRSRCAGMRGRRRCQVMLCEPSTRPASISRSIHAFATGRWNSAKPSPPLWCVECLGWFQVAGSLRDFMCIGIFLRRLD